MKLGQGEEKNKRSYEKPRLRTIELVADQVLGVGCKTVSIGGLTPGAGTCALGTACNNVDTS